MSADAIVVFGLPGMATELFMTERVPFDTVAVLVPGTANDTEVSPPKRASAREGRWTPLDKPGGEAHSG